MNTRPVFFRISRNRRNAASAPSMRPKALSGSIAKYSRGLALSALALIGASQAPGAIYYWDSNGGTADTGGIGNWYTGSSPSLWRLGSDTGTLGTWTNLSTDEAVFGGTAGTVTLTTDITANRLTFTTAGYTLTATSSRILTLGGTTPTITLTSGDTTFGSNIRLAGTTGLTVAGGGGRLFVGGGATPFDITGGITVNGALLGINGGSVTNLIPTSNSLTLNGGQLFNYSVNGISQTWNGLTFSGGSSVTSYTIGGNSFTVAFGAITRASAGSILFQRLGNNNIGSVPTHTTTTINTNGILGPWALYNQATVDASVTNFVPDNSWRYAVGSAAGVATTITGLAGSTVTNAESFTDATANYNFSGAVTLTASRTANTARYTGTSLTTTTIPNGTTLTLNGLLNGGTSSGGATNIANSSVLTIASTGTGALAIGSTNELVVTAGVNNIAISAPITGGNSSGGLTIMGYNSLRLVTLSGANTYSGKTTINAGTLVIGAAGGVIPDASDVTIASSNIGLRPTDPNFSAAVLDLNGNSETIGGLNGTGRVTTNTTAGTSTLTVGASNVASATFSGVIQNNVSGLVALTKTGTGIQTLSGANTYTGLTTVSAGTLEVTVNNALGTNAAGTSVTSGATLKLTGVNYSTTEGLIINGTGVSSGGALASSGTTTFAGLITAATSATINAISGTLELSGGLVKDGTTLTFTGAGAFTISSVISGASANSDLAVDGTTVTLTAANTYNGPTTITNGGTLIANVLGALPLSPRSAVSFTGGGTSTLSLGANQEAASLTSTGAATVTLGSNTLTIGITGGNTTFAGSIGGTNGNLIKDTNSTQVLSGSNGYTGTTTVSAGTLEVTGSLTGTTAVTVNTSGTLLLNSAASPIINTAATMTVGGGTVKIDNSLNNTNQTFGSLTRIDSNEMTPGKESECGCN